MVLLVLLLLSLFALSRKQICFPLEIDHFWDRKSRQDVQDQCPFVFGSAIVLEMLFFFRLLFFSSTVCISKCKIWARRSGRREEKMLTDLLAICKHLPLALFTCFFFRPLHIELNCTLVPTAWSWITLVPHQFATCSTRNPGKDHSETDHSTPVI